MPPKPNPKLKPASAGAKQKQDNSSEKIVDDADGALGVRRTRRKVGLAEYDNIIIGYVKDHYRPSEIADRLRDEHGLSPAVANRAAVERHIRFLKKNRLADLPPTNDPDTLRAKPTTCFFLFPTDSFLFPFINSFSIHQGKLQELLLKLCPSLWETLMRMEVRRKMAVKLKTVKRSVMSVSKRCSKEYLT